MATPGRTRALFIFRALLALAVLAGYYTLSLVIAALCIGALVLLFTTRSKAPSVEVLLCASMAGFALYAAGRTLLSTRRRIGDEAFLGTWLEREREPEFFGVVEELAQRMGTRPPDRIVVLHGGNAGVTERGGFLGYGSERILALGYFEIRRCTRSELRATLAHELGHFAAGDTFLGPLVHRSHEALVSSMTTLAQQKNRHLLWFEAGRTTVDGILGAYGKLALRASLAAGRLHELEADRQAVLFAGRAPHLRSLESAAPDLATFEHFLAREVEPLATAGHWPEDFWAGYDAFADAVRDEMRNASQSLVVGPYDTHPSFAARVAFAEKLDDPRLDDDTRPALTLFADPDGLWREIEELVDGERPRAPWSAAATLRSKNMETIASKTFTKYDGLIRGDSWLDRATDGVRFVREEGAESLVSASSSSLRRMPQALVPIAFGQTFGAIVGLALVEGRGGRFVHAFGKSLQVDLDGELHCPLTLATEAARSNDGLETLAALLGVNATTTSRLTEEDELEALEA